MDGATLAVGGAQLETRKQARINEARLRTFTVNRAASWFQRTPR
jgi:hypothetical protein